MDRILIQEKLRDVIGKNKYLILILCVGLIIILLSPSKETVAEKQVISESQDNILTVEEQLSKILSSVKGAGKVQVMLSVVSGEETLYQTNEDHTSGTDRTSVNKDTVTVTDASRNQSGLVRQINPPVYSGAVVVCQGADNPTVKLSIVAAVSKITGLGTDKISVLKMK